MGSFNNAIAPSVIAATYMEAYDLSKNRKIPTGFGSFFGAGMGNGGKTVFVTDAKQVEFDVRDRTQTMASLQPRGMVADPLDKPKLVGQGFSRFSRAFPIGEESGFIHYDQSLEPTFGEKPYQARMRRDRMKDLALDNYIAQTERAARLYEYLSCQALTTGYMPMIVGTTDTSKRWDTLRADGHIDTVDVTWATDTTDIQADLNSACSLVKLDSGLTADCAICGDNVPGYVKKNVAIRADANAVGPNGSGMQLVYFGENVKPGPQFNRMIENGFVPFAKLVLGPYTLTLFTYPDQGYDIAGSWTKFIDDDDVIVMSSQIRADRYFGPGEMMPPNNDMREDYREFFGFDIASPMPPQNLVGSTDVIVAQSFYPWIRRASDNKGFDCGIQYAPGFNVVDTNAVVKLHTTP